MATSPDASSSRPVEGGHGSCLERLPPGFLIRRTQQIHAALWAIVVSDEVTIPQFAVLRVLHEEPWIDQSTLGSRAALDRSNTADVVRRLASRQLLYRHGDLEDGRRHLLGLTPKGEALYGSLLERTHELNERLLAALGSNSRAEIVRLLASIVEHGERDLEQRAGVASDATMGVKRARAGSRRRLAVGENVEPRVAGRARRTSRG